MQSYQNLIILKNLYRLKSLGFNYGDAFSINQPVTTPLSKNLYELAKNIQNCHLCDFSKSRRQSMSGFGSINAKIFFIDYTVSANEDDLGSYYVGRSGEMLKNMIQNVLKLSINDVYITHMIKCKPLKYAKNYDSNLNSCQNYLFEELNIIKPKVIVTLGNEAYGKITNDVDGFDKNRGLVLNYNGSLLVPLHHPSHLLKNPKDKQQTLNDLTTIKSLL